MHQNSECRVHNWSVNHDQEKNHGILSGRPPPGLAMHYVGSWDLIALDGLQKIDGQTEKIRHDLEEPSESSQESSLS